MAKSKKTAAVKKQTTEASAPKPAAPTTNPENNPTVVPPVTDKNVADPNVNDNDIVDDENVTPPVEGGAAAQAPVNGDDEPIVEENENEDEQIEQVEVKESMKREELNEIGLAAGLADVATYKDKAAVVVAINRVRNEEEAYTVNEELKAVAQNENGDVEVEVIAPFYDAEVQVDRRAGKTYKTTEERAKKLRALKLVK